MDRQIPRVPRADVDRHGERALASLWTSIGQGDTDRAIAIATYIAEVQPPAEVAAKVQAALGLILQRAGRAVESRDRFEAAADLVPDLPARASYLADAATSRWLAGDLDGAERTALRVLHLGESLENWFAVCEATDTLAAVRHARGDVTGAHSLAREAVRIGGTRLLGDGGGATPHLFLGAALLDLDWLDEADDAFSAGLQRVSSATEAQTPWFLGFRALGRLLAGRWDDALADVEECLAVSARTGTTVTRPLAAGVGAIILSSRDRRTDAAALVDSAGDAGLGAFGGFGEEALLLARALLAETDADRHDALSQAWLLRRDRPFYIAWRVIAPALVRSALDAGNLRLATAVTEEAEEGARRAEGVPSADACALRCRAHLTADPALLAEAVAVSRGAGRPFGLAQAGLDAGRAWLAAGDPQRAVPFLLEAWEQFSFLDAAWWLARTDALLAEATGAA